MVNISGLGFKVDIPLSRCYANWNSLIEMFECESQPKPRTTELVNLMKQVMKRNE